MRRVLGGSLLLAALASLANVVDSQTLGVNVLGNFESPLPPNGAYIYNPPVTPIQPWTWPGFGGVGVSGHDFDPPPPTQPPSPAQYGFIQISPSNAPDWYNSSMWTNVTGLTANQQYNLSWYSGVRYDSGTGNQTTSQETVLFNNVPIWMSAPTLAMRAAGSYQHDFHSERNFGHSDVSDHRAR